MTTYTLTVSTNDLGLGVLNSVRTRIEKRRVSIADTYPPINNLVKIEKATNNLGVAIFLLEPDDLTTYHVAKVFDSAGIPVYEKSFTMPPSAVNLHDSSISTAIGGSLIQFKKNGNYLGTPITVRNVDIVGSGVDATFAGDTVTIDATGVVPLDENSNVPDQYLNFVQAGSGSVARTVQDKARDIVSVKDFGAKGDDDTDDTLSIQLAINTVGAAGGGTIYFPRGTYRVTSQLNINYPGINLRGTGRSGVYPGGYSESDPRGSLILATDTHSGPNVLRFFSNTINSLSGFSCCDMGFAVDRTTSSPSLDCFGWDMGHFQYDFVFNRVSVHLFNIGFHLYKTGSLTDQAAALKICDSNINHNNLIAKTTGSNTTWNGFEMVGCNAGQQQVGGIDIKATGCVIHNNILEGQPNPIKINGINSPTSIKNNYFEQTMGNANIHIDTSRGAVDIGPNYHYNSGSTKVTHRVLLDSCAFVRCVDPYWSCKTYKCSPLPQVKKGDVVHGMGDTSSVYTSIQRFFRADDPNTIMGVSEISPNSVVVLLQGRRELSPINHEPMQCCNFSTGGTTETNAIATSFSSTTVDAGKWIVVSWLLKYDHALNPAHQPYISWPAGVLDGSQDLVLGQFSQVSNIGEFYVFTAAYRCATAISSAFLQMNFYPYGVSNPTVGNTCAFGGVTMSIVDSVEDIKPYVSPMAMRGATAVPSVGTWKVGDTLLNVAPAAGGAIGWVCISGGTPGTWKSFGTIEA